MRLSLVTIESGADGAVQVDPATLIDLLWTVTARSDRVEHITASCGPGRIEIGVYSGHADASEATAHAAGLVRRALVSSVLHRWIRVDAADLPLHDI